MKKFYWLWLAGALAWSRPGSCEPPASVAPNIPPEPVIVFHEEGAASYTFSASASMDVDGEISLYSWDFGDGSYGVGETVWHRFPAVGAYSVTLRVSDNHSAQRTMVQTVLISPVPNQPALGARMRKLPDEVFVGEPIEFSVETVPQQDWRGYVQWNLGNGEHLRTQHSRYSYSRPGLYTVSLKMTGAQGKTYAQQASIRVIERVAVGRNTTRH